MSSIPFFVNRLSLPWDADERAVKRAYARELKLIDQENDPDGFQALREAYDAALHWARQGQDSAVARTVPVSTASTITEAPITPATETPADSEQTEEGAGPRALAEAVFDLTLDRLTKVPANAEHAEKLLTLAMADERMQSVDARDIFEYLVAAWLAQGWRPGNEALFSAAPKFFNWTDDRRRLLRFGRAGGAMDAAINELLMFNDLQPSAREQCMNLIRDLRTTCSPQRLQLSRSAAALDYLVAHYPTLIPTITDVANVTIWQEKGREFHNKDHTRDFAKSAVARPPVAAKEGWRPSGFNFFWFWIALVLVRALMGTSSSPAPDPGLSQTRTYQEMSSPPSNGIPDAPPLGYAQSAAKSRVPDDPTAMTWTATRELQPLSAAEIRAASAGKPNAENCTKLAIMAHDYGMGTPAAMASFGRDTERQVVNCVLAKQWTYRFPWGTTKDPAVEISFDHLIRQANRKDEPLRPTKLYDVDFPAPPAPDASQPSVHADEPPASDVSQNGTAAKRIGNYNLGASNRYDPASMRLLDAAPRVPPDDSP